jgi:hypothetical protein
MNAPRQPTTAPTEESATIRPSLRGERQSTERVATRSERDTRYDRDQRTDQAPGDDGEASRDESETNRAPDRNESDNSDRSQRDVNRADESSDNNQSRDQQD